MIKMIISALLLISFTIQSDKDETPTLIPLNLKGDLAKKYSFQFSSIVIKNDSLILVAEKCKKIYILNKNTLDIISVIETLVNTDIKSIEGITLYKGRYLFMLDEDNKAVYSFDLTGEFSLKKIADADMLKDGKTGKLEGIAINENRSICYISTEEAPYKIFLFDIAEDNMLLRRQGISEILLPEKNWTRRTDLYYDNDKFYILATNYPNTTPAKYGVDVFQIDSTGTVLIPGYKKIDLTSCNYLPNNFEYDQNLEGITRDGKYFYVISDNHYSSHSTCDESQSAKKTLLFKFDGNHN